MIEPVETPRKASVAATQVVSLLPAILDAVADGVTVQDASGRLVYANEAALRLIGFAALDELLAATSEQILARFELVDESLEPMSPAELPGRLALEGRDGGTRVVGYRAAGFDDIRWTQVRATPLRDTDGQVTHAINTFHDITERLEAEHAVRASEARYRQLVEAMPQVAWTADPTGRLVSTNERWSEYTGLSGDKALESGFGVHPDDQAGLEARWQTSIATGDPLELGVRLRRHDGAWRWHLIRAVPSRTPDGEITAWTGTSTDIHDERRAQVGSRLLAEAAERLDETLDPGQTVRAGADIAVPVLADWCVIDLFQPDGTIRRSAVSIADPADAEAAAGLQAFATDLESDAPLAIALRESRTELRESITEEQLDRVARNDAHRRILGQMAPSSVLAVPLIARQRTMGAMALIFGRSGRRFGPEDVALSESLAHRVALALSNAELYAGEQAAREAAEATAARMEALQRMTRTLAQASSRADVARIATEDGAAALGASTAVLYVPNIDGGLEMAAQYGYPPEDLAGFTILSPDDPLPTARAFATRKPAWIEDAAAVREGDQRLAGPRASRGPAAGAAVPLIVEDRAVGVLGLGFSSRPAFVAADRDLTLAQANVVASALERVTLSDAREHLLVDLEAQRNRLEAVLRQMPAGVLIADASGRLVLSNGQAGEIWREPIPVDRDIRGYLEYIAWDLDGERLDIEAWPLTRALATGEIVTGQQLRIERFDGTQGWIAVDAAPIRDRDGVIVAAVSTFTDISAQRLAADRQAFLAEASGVLASSLDYEETVARVVRATVPKIADWAVIDLVGEGGELERLAVAHVDPAKIALVAELRERYPTDPTSPNGPHEVIRTGKAQLVGDIPASVYDALPDERYRKAVLDLQLHSYMCVPLVAGGEVLGAISFVGAESGRRFDEDDLLLAEALAARAASAIQNARLFRDVARYKAILDTSLDAVFMFDPASLRILYVNRGAVDQLGWDQAAILEMAPADLIPELDETRLRALIAPLVEGRVGARTITVTLRHKDGRHVPFEVLLQHIEPPGETGRVVSIARDISDRVEAQARLQRLAESEHARAAELNAVIRAMGEGVVVCDEVGRIVLANPAAEELFPDIGGSTYDEVLARLTDAAGQTPALGERGGPVELRVIGEPERWIELSTYPVASRDGGRADFGRGPETIVLLRDITVARQRQAVRDTFIGVLSHELRTPVTTIYAGSKVLARSSDRLDEEVRRSVFEDIHIEAERLHRLVEDVIALTRFGEEEASEVGKEPVLLQRVLPVVIRSEEVRWPGVTFELDVPGGIPTVVADPTYVEQVVRNLLSNAAKYAGPGSHVRAVVETTDDEILVRIQDDGPGFPDAESERLFELFFRSPSTAATASGAGIGLFVCARLIRAMGGRIWALPRPQGGAEFGFSLRRMSEDDTAL